MKTFFFFGRHEGKLETFAKICVVASLETLREDPTVRIRDKQAAWKLLSKISRTAPEASYHFKTVYCCILSFAVVFVYCHVIFKHFKYIYYIT